MHAQIDKVVDRYFRQYEKFTIANIIDDIGSEIESEKRRLTEKAERELSVDDRFFYDQKLEYFYSRQKFFHHAEFVITPTEAEINDGILFPGHRFLPFAFSEVFPSEITFGECGSKPLKMLKKSVKVSELIPYHLLMGTEQIGDFLVAEDPEHDIYATNSTPDSLITVSVFNMADIYRAYKFKQGDVLVARVLDWEKGIFDFTCRTAAQRDFARIKHWVNEYSIALEKAIDDFESYLELPEFLAWGFFYGGKELFGENGGSLDEFYRMMERVEIRFDQGQSILAKAEPEEEPEMPEDICISTGETGSLEAIMAQAGYPLTMNELDAYMLDNCYNRELEFADFYARCFGDRRLDFVDEAQEVIFMNYLEDRWEDISSSYNREFDLIKAPLRERILELTSERIEWPQTEDLRRLAGHLSSILGMLNSPKTDIGQEEAESMFDMVERSAELQAELIEKINLSE